MLDNLPKEHQRKILAAAQHGETHVFLVPPLKRLLSRLDASSVKKADGQETLKTSSFHNHKPPISAASPAIASLPPLSARLMERILKDTTTLYLYCRQYITYLSIRPSIRMLVQQIKELGYLVVVHLHPNNNFRLILNSNGAVPSQSKTLYSS
jgi:hypothetical protein